MLKVPGLIYWDYIYQTSKRVPIEGHTAGWAHWLHRQSGHVLGFISSVRTQDVPLGRTFGPTSPTHSMPPPPGEANVFVRPFGLPSHSALVYGRPWCIFCLQVRRPTSRLIVSQLRLRPSAVLGPRPGQTNKFDLLGKLNK